jgi:hypothetical protein
MLLSSPVQTGVIQKLSMRHEQVLVSCIPGFKRMEYEYIDEWFGSINVNYYFAVR